MAHYGIFRQELAIAYPTYGNALWEPDPGGQYNAVEVGDVGFIRRGYFQRLFNVLLPKDHPFHRNPSFVPEDHQQLVTIHDHIVKNEIRTGSRQNSLHFCSQYVTLDSRGRGTLASGPEDDSQITFSCNGKQGALLSLPVPAQGEDTVAFGDFGKWMIKHIDTWFAFARGLGLGINRMEDIILVTGRHLTKSWVNVAFTQRRSDAGVSFDAQAFGHSHVSLEQEYVRGGDLKLGPTGRDLPENQCIFIRGFRVARILGMWPKLRGQAGPAPNPGDQEPESDPQLEIISVPDSNFPDPLHDLLQYVAEQSPDCDMALVHDNDLACMDVAPRTAFRTHEFMGHLRKSAPTIQQFQSELLSGDKSGSGAEVAVAKVATLSEHAFEALHKGSDLNPVPTTGGATDRSAPVADLPVTSSVSASSRLDGAAYDVEQKRIETEIGLLHETLAAVNDKISNTALVSDNFTAFSSQIEDLQPRHRSNMTSRNEILNQIIALQRGILIKERTLRVSRENEKIRTAEDGDAHIRNPEVQVRSGATMDTKESLRPLPAPPQTSNDTKNNDITHTSTSPAQLALILSTVLADNEILSKDLAVARARYERAEQTLALLNPPHTSVTVASNTLPPPSAYPEPAVRTIMDLQSHLEAEKAGREATESRLRTISEAWLDLDRYFQASEVHLSDARAHFSQLLRDPFTKPSFNTLPAYQPHPSSLSASHSPVAPSQTFPTFSQPSVAASLPDRVRHRDGNTEDVPPPKRIRTDQGPRDAIESSRIHYRLPPSSSMAEMNRRLHSAYPVQQPPSRGRRPERRDQSPSLSLSPTCSRSSSMSLDELRGSPSSHQPAYAYPGPSSFYRPVSSTRHSRSPDYRSSHTVRRDTVPQSNVVSPAITPTAQPLPQPPPQPQPHGQYQALQTLILAPLTGPSGKKPKPSEGTPVSTAPSPRSVAGLASLPSPPPSVAGQASLPPPPPSRAVNDRGQRICRQCGLPGRYKEGKCVEKWGPGPEGPGTVCERCRKRMKRVVRRGMLDPHSQTAAFVHSSPHVPIQERDHAHGPLAQQGTGSQVQVAPPKPPIPPFSGEGESDAEAREIVDAKPIGKVVESFQANPDEIDADYAAIKKLIKQLDDSEAEAVLEAEMDVMKGKGALFGNPSLLFEKQRKLQRQINALFSERYDLISRLREDDTRYYAMLNEGWSQRAEREAKIEDQHLPMQIEGQIDDCQMLIEYFSGMSTTAMDNLMPLVKTGEYEEDSFFGTKDRSEFKKSPKAHSATVGGEMSSSSSIDLPPYTRSTLRSLSILPPSSPSDIPRVVENLKARKARLEEISEIQQNLLKPVDGADSGLLGDDAGKPKSEELQETEVS